MPRRLRRLVVAVLLAAAVRGGAGEVALDVVTLAAPLDTADRTVAAPGARLVATAPTRLTGALALQPGAIGGLQATIVASSLRTTTADDWRTMGIAAGERRDPRIEFSARAGTPEERARFKVGGTDDDWDSFSIQWDGWLRIDQADTALALSSDDGARCWIDRDGDGAIGPGEWGDNGWGTGHGDVRSTVHQHLQPGVYRVRVQWEDGGGPNCCRLLWNANAGTPAAHGYVIVPDEAFANVATAEVAGSITVAGAVTGAGSVLRLIGGAQLATAPAVAAVEVADRAALAADCAMAAVALRLSPQAELSCAGHALAAARADGGTIALAGGSLALPAGRHAVAVQGPG